LKERRINKNDGKARINKNDGSNRYSKGRQKEGGKLQENRKDNRTKREAECTAEKQK
jgi:hypothetical protein